MFSAGASDEEQRVKSMVLALPELGLVRVPKYFGVSKRMSVFSSRKQNREFPLRLCDACDSHKL